MQGRELAHELEDVSVGDQPVEQDPPGGGRVLGRGQLPGRHTLTVGQMPQSGDTPAGLHGRGLSRPAGVAPVRDRQDCDDPRPVTGGVKSTVTTAPGGQDVLAGRV